MDIKLEPGKYVVAVSGGVDSVVLLDMLVRMNDERRTKNEEGNSSSPFSVHRSPFTFFVAHFDHGIRENSAEDRQFVETLAKHYGLPYIYEEGQLGAGVGEAKAREVRYQFLQKVRKSHDALAIITAHHEDDLIETALLNMLRGTNRRGLSSLRSTDDIKRPLLKMSKQELINYAKANGLTWREDSTNLDDKYLRNYIRHQLVPQLSAADRTHLLEILSNTGTLNDIIDKLLVEQLGQQVKAQALDRRWFINLPHAVAREVLAAWLRQQGVNFDRPTLERMVVAGKTKLPGKQVDVNNALVLDIQQHKLALATRDR